MSIQLGQVPAVVISSPQAAELVLRTNDAVFASRPTTQASEYLAYGSKGIAFGRYGPYWRNMRKLCVTELFSSAKIDSFSAMRREEMGLLVEELKEAAVARKVVDVSVKVGKVIEGITYKMVLGDNKFDGNGLKEAVGEALTLAGAFNLADFVPFLGALDLQVIFLVLVLFQGFKILLNYLKSFIFLTEKDNIGFHKFMIRNLRYIIHDIKCTTLISIYGFFCFICFFFLLILTLNINRVES